MKKKFVSSVLLAAMVFGSSSAFAADTDLPVLISSAPSAEETIVGVPQISVDGNAVDLSKLNVSQYMYTENDNTLVPLRAVAEKTGYKVDWNEADNSVSVNNDEWEVVLEIGVDSYFGVTKIKDAVGMTAPQTYGTAPKIIDDTTYVPAKMFELMGYDFSSVGQYASFTKAGANDNNAVQIPNPLVEYKTVDEAKNTLSFDAPVPTFVPDGYKIDYVGTIAGETLQIFYKNGKNEIVFRTEKSESDDISGVYETYERVENADINGITAVLKGSGEKINIAVFKNGASAYSVYSPDGLVKDEIIKIIGSI